jgi:Spy/CpxP family protein refolding chaperone
MRLKSVLFLSTLLALPLFAAAQPPQPPDGPVPAAEHRGPPSPERMTEHLKRDLNLSDEQAAKMLAVHKQMAAEKKRMHDQHEKEMQKILTPEQWTKFQSLRKEHMERRRARRGAPDAEE